MAKKPVKYTLVDAFTELAFKGNPAAVCFLEEDSEREDKWLQAVAAEFNISQTCFLSRIAKSEQPVNLLSGTSTPRFRLRWFTPITEASRRGGVFNIHLDEQNQRVLLRGKAITVMEGCLLV